MENMWNYRKLTPSRTEEFFSLSEDELDLITTLRKMKNDSPFTLVDLLAAAGNAFSQEISAQHLVKERPSTVSEGIVLSFATSQPKHAANAQDRASVNTESSHLGKALQTASQSKSAPGHAHKCQSDTCLSGSSSVKFPSLPPLNNENKSQLTASYRQHTHSSSSKVRSVASSFPVPTYSFRRERTAHLTVFHPEPEKEYAGSFPKLILLKSHGWVLQKMWVVGITNHVVPSSGAHTLPKISEDEEQDRTGNVETNDKNWFSFDNDDDILDLVKLWNTATFE